MNNRYPFVNTPLPYPYNALEPYIDEKTMHLHHDRHLQTYIDNLNAILKVNPVLQKFTLEELILNWNKLPVSVQVPIRNNGGGVYNHRFYFDSLQPPQPTDLRMPQTIDLKSSHPMEQNSLYKEIEEQFQGFDEFKRVFKQEALSVFGSGYTWLVLGCGMLRIVNTPNQDIPDIKRLKPILCIDVWEHAYYLKHYNMRGDYVDDWFSVINWDKAEERYRK